MAVVEPLGDETILRDHRSIRERDLDNFMLEELQASAAFRAWFLGHLSHCFKVPVGCRAVVGKNPEREIEPGQTDLHMTFRDQHDVDVAIVLIEDKVRSGFQSGQAERYASERRAALERLGPKRGATVMVAPSSNTAVLDHPSFDASIRLEDIVRHLRHRARELEAATDMVLIELRSRLIVRADLVEALAAKRSYNGNWTPNPVLERVDFMEQYLHVGKRMAPHLQLTASSGGPKATTVLFTGVDVPGIAVANIRHDFGKSQRVSMKIECAGKAKGALDKFGLLPPLAFTEVADSGALMIRLKTEAIDPKGERFEEQRSRVEGAIRSVLQLEVWAQENADRIVDSIK